MTTRIYTGPSVTAAPGNIALGTFENLIMTRNALLSVQDGIGIIGTGGIHRLAIAGDIAASDQGISLSGISNQVTITASGSITSGESAIAIAGTGTRITNFGHLTSLGVFAINLTNIVGTDAPPSAGIVSVFNSGTIRGGMASVGNALTLYNSGLIVGVDTFSPGPLTIQGGTASDYVNNIGTIQGTIDLGEASDTLINRGTIDGSILMGLGNDLVDNRLGLISSSVLLGDGDDTYRPGADRDTAVGGAGIDTVDFRRGGPVTFALDGSAASGGAAEGDSLKEFENLMGSNIGSDLLIGNDSANTIEANSGDDALNGRGGDDFLYGGAGNDVVRGEAGADRIDGAGGNDTLFGDGDKDNLTGGDGNDILDGGSGADKLFGGGGLDTFVFGQDMISPGSLDSSTDIVLDLATSIDEKIDLSAIDAISGNKVDGVAVNDAFTWIGSDKFHKLAGELRYTPGVNGLVIQGDVNGDGIADLAIKLPNNFIPPVDHLVL